MYQGLLCEHFKILSCSVSSFVDIKSPLHPTDHSLPLKYLGYNKSRTFFVFVLLTNLFLNESYLMPIPYYLLVLLRLSSPEGNLDHIPAVVTTYS